MRTFEDEPPLYGQDPHLTILDTGARLLIQSEDESRIIISDYDRPGTRKVVWDPKGDEHQIWAPELHLVNGIWIILYSSSDGNNATHRNKALHSILPLGPYFPTQTTGPDIWAIDSTVFMHNWRYYVAWSGWRNNGDEFPQHLYIAEWGSRDRQILASPRLDWEGQLLEGPQWCPETQRLYYSANASWSQDYATGFLQLKSPEHDPLNPGAWKKHPDPIAKNFGHAQPLGNNRFIGHTKLSPFPGWSDRVIEERVLAV